MSRYTAPTIGLRFTTFRQHTVFALKVLLTGSAKMPQVVAGTYSPDKPPSPPIPYKLPDPDHDPHKTPVMNPPPVEKP
jgi:hypothetical protein